MMPELERRLLEKWSEFALPGRRPRRVQFLQASPPGEGRSDVILFAFRPGARAPVALAKVKRAPSEREALRTEATVLQTLGERLPAALRETLPRLLELHAMGAQRALLLKAPKGAILARRAACGRPPGLRWLLRTGLDWLCAFQQATRDGDILLVEEPLQRHVATPIEACGERLGAAPTAALREALTGALGGTSLFLCARHGAFRPEHVFRRGRRLTVVNWEQGEERALPLLDALQLITSAAAECLCHWAGVKGGAAAFRQTWLEATPVRSIAVRALARYAAAVGIEAGAAAWTLPVFVADQARRPAPRQTVDNHWYDCLRLLAEDPGRLARLADAIPR